MMYMAGNSVQIFSVMIVSMLLFSSVKGLLGLSGVFSPYIHGGKKSDPLLGCKITYLALNLVLMGMGVWKCAGMGLLPTAQSDWLAFKSAVGVVEYSVGGTVFPVIA